MTFPTVTFSAAEVDRGAAEPAQRDEAARLFHEHGAVRLINVFPAGFRERLRAHYLRRFATELEATKQADQRPLFTVPVEGPIAEATYLANPLLVPILARLLGDDFAIGAISTVISFPGAPQQFIHRDAPSLGGDYNVDATLPPYSLTMLMPMVDANQETGSTRVWLGSHRLADPDAKDDAASDSPDVPVGSVLITDSRVLHCGSPNRSIKVRPLLYNTYHRAWFRDFWGYERRQSISISRAVRAQIPPDLELRFRIADEANGQPEGPRSVPEWVRNVLPAELRAAWQRIPFGSRAR